MASRLIKPETVSAATNDPVLVDQPHNGVGTTSISSTTVDAAVSADGVGIGVRGSSVDGTGVRGASSDDAVVDFSVAGNRAGVIGVAGDPGTPGGDGAIALNTGESGVYGFSAISASSAGVWGDSDSNGTGVAGSGGTGVFGVGFYGVYAFGRAAVTGEGDVTDTGVYGYAGAAAAPLPPAGVGVQATAGSTAQVALNVTGKAKFSRSGRTYVATGAYARRVNMAGVTTASYIIATLQTRRTGVYVHAVVPATGYFVIYLNKAVTANTYVGYLVIN
jgi:hypothetical protein